MESKTNSVIYNSTCPVCMVIMADPCKLPTCAHFICVGCVFEMNKHRN